MYKKINTFEEYGIRDSLGMKLFLIVSSNEGLTILEILEHLGINKVTRREYDNNKKHLLKLCHGVTDRYVGLRLVSAKPSTYNTSPGQQPYVFTLTAKGKRLKKELSI